VKSGVFGGVVGRGVIVGVTPGGSVPGSEVLVLVTLRVGTLGRGVLVIGDCGAGSSSRGSGRICKTSSNPANWSRL
jgi:hypothetical protein